MKKLVDGILVDLTVEEISEKEAQDLESLKEQSQNNNIEQAPYINQRKNAYPEIGDQLDMLWHTMDKDMELQHKFYDFYQTIKKVKVAHPKK